MRANDGAINFPPPGTMVLNGNVANAHARTIIADNELFGATTACSDNTGKTLILSTQGSAPWLRAYILDNSTGIYTELTLSGFGTFTSAPAMHLAGYDTEGGKYWVSWQAVGGSGSLAVDRLNPLTLSGSTLTLGTAVTPPAIASKAVNPYGNAVYNGKIIQTYSDTATFLVDAARVYDISGASWAAPSGGTASPYAANANANLGGNLPDYVSFASGSQNGKAYMSVTHASILPLFVEFNFSTESFTDRTSLVPIEQSNNDNFMWSMALDHEGDYGLGYYQNSNAQYNFIYDTANNQTIALWPLQDSVYCKMLAGDESNGVLATILTDAGTDWSASKAIYKTVSGSGVLCGIEVIGNHVSTNVDYGADDTALLYKIDGGSWIKSIRTPSLWQRGGYKNIMQPYSTSLEVIAVMPLFSGNYEARTIGSLFYTTD